MLKKAVSLFLLIILAGKIAIAQENKPIFTSVNAGDVAPFGGFLFTKEAIIKIYTDTEAEKKKIQLEKEAKIAEINLELQKTTELAKSQLEIKDQLLKEIELKKNTDIKERDKQIQDLSDANSAKNFLIAGSFIGGIAITTAVFYIVAGAFK